MGLENVVRNMIIRKKTEKLLECSTKLQRSFECNKVFFFPWLNSQLCQVKVSMKIGQLLGKIQYSKAFLACGDSSSVSEQC